MMSNLLLVTSLYGMEINGNQMQKSGCSDTAGSVTLITDQKLLLYTASNRVPGSIDYHTPPLHAGVHAAPGHRSTSPTLRVNELCWAKL